MKTLKFLFLFVLLASCQPLSLDKDRGDGEGRRDEARGEKDFKLPNIEDIGLDEIRKKANSENCDEYDKHTCHSLVGKFSPLRPFRNCFAKALEESLKPTCELENQYKEALEYYEDEGDRDKVEEIESGLGDIEEQKYEVTDELYLIADEFDKLTEDMIGDIDDKEEEAGNSIFEKFLAGGARVVTRTEVGSFTRCLDARARRLCSNIDFSKIQNRRERR